MIFVTARARLADIDSYAALGAIRVVIKPFDPLSLAADVRRLIDRHGK